MEQESRYVNNNSFLIVSKHHKKDNRAKHEAETFFA